MLVSLLSSRWSSLSAGHPWQGEEVMIDQFLLNMRVLVTDTIILPSVLLTNLDIMEEAL